MTQLEAANGQATFEVCIASAGVPAQYTYQWYENGAAVSGATGSTYKRTGLTSVGTYNIYCIVTSAAGSVTSRTAVLNVQSAKPEFTCSAQNQLIKEDQYNYGMKFLTSGIITFSHLGCFANKIDVFCVGGGAGTPSGQARAGGGGGYTKTQKNISVASNIEYEIVVGAGGPGGNDGNVGGTSSAFGCSAAGGGSDGNYYNGGSGGGAGGKNGPAGNGGSDGSNGKSGYNSDGPGVGQGTTTSEFGESGATLYAGGGGGATDYAEDYEIYGYGGDGGGGRGFSPNNGGSTNGAANTGGGGGGGYGSGGSGIVVIRNAR